MPENLVFSFSCLYYLADAYIVFIGHRYRFAVAHIYQQDTQQQRMLVNTGVDPAGEMPSIVIRVAGSEGMLLVQRSSILVHLDGVTMPSSLPQTVPVYSSGPSVISRCASFHFQKFPTLDDKLYVRLNSGAHRNILVA